MTLYILGALALIGLLFYLNLRRAIKKSVHNVRRPAEEPDEGTVQCFSCGMSVPVEKALEKKGRYFCGVKRNDRNGVPIEDSAESQ